MNTTPKANRDSYLEGIGRVRLAAALMIAAILAAIVAPNLFHDTSAERIASQPGVNDLITAACE